MGSNLDQDINSCWIFCSTCALPLYSQLNYDEYTDHTLEDKMRPRGTGLATRSRVWRWRKWSR